MDAKEAIRIYCQHKEICPICSAAKERTYFQDLCEIGWAMYKRWRQLASKKQCRYIPIDSSINL